jgi:acetylornithine deacetylase/succinyl-diaminopimelate desuccinylase-like protein
MTGSSFSIAPDSEIEKKILAGITEERWLSLAQELIVAGQPEAENPLDPDVPSGREEGIALVVADKLRAMGLDVTLDAKRPGRPNVIGILQGEESPSLILNDHLDTYPSGDHTLWTETGGNPYHPTRKGDFLFSRGTSDTRGNLACTLLAVQAMLEAGVRPFGTLKCVYTVDEEKNGPDGSIYLLDEKGLTADYEITCEPTGWTQPDENWGMSLALANSGHFLVELEMKGVQSHLWRPDIAVNPVEHMNQLLSEVETLNLVHSPPQMYGGTRPRATVLRIQGGAVGELQFTPGWCRAVLGLVGLVPGMTAESVLADVTQWITKRCEGIHGLVATVRPYPGALFVAGTIEQDPDRQPALAVRNAYRRLLGDEPVLYRKNAFNDTIRFSERGIPAVTFGPGEDGWPPINEYIRVQKSVAGAQVLALAMLEILGVRKIPE